MGMVVAIDNDTITMIYYDYDHCHDQTNDAADKLWTDYYYYYYILTMMKNTEDGNYDDKGVKKAPAYRNI